MQINSSGRSQKKAFIKYIESPKYNEDIKILNSNKKKNPQETRADLLCMGTPL